MIVIYMIAALAAGALASDSIEKTFDAKPCDAKTGCLHPAFK